MGIRRKIGQIFRIYLVGIFGFTNIASAQTIDIGITPNEPIHGQDSRPTPEEVRKLQAYTSSAALDPFNASSVDPLLKLVQKHQAFWQSSPAGRSALARATQVVEVNLIKKNLDDCLGYDSLSRPDSSRLLEAAAKFVPKECGFSVSSFAPLADMTTILFYGNKDEKKADDFIMSVAADDLLRRAIALDAKWHAAIKDLPQVGSVLDHMCPESKCPGWRSSFKVESEHQFALAVERNPKPKSLDEAARELNANRKEMFGILYSSARPYHLSHSSNPGDQKRYQVYQAESAGLSDLELYQKYGSHMSRLAPPNSGADERDENLRQATREVIQQIPEDFFTAQQKMNANPVADLVSRGKSEWQNTLGFFQDPHAIYRPGNHYEVTLHPPFDDSTTSISAAKIADTYKEQMNLIFGKVEELQSANQGQAEKEMLKKLIVADPRGIARALMIDPQLNRHICHALQALAHDKLNKDIASWSLLGATVAATVATGGFAALGMGSAAMTSGLALSATAGAQSIMALKEGIANQELAGFEEAACFGSSTSDRSCREYKVAMKEATNSYIESGLAATGAIPFLSASMRLAHGSVTLFSARLAFLPELAQISKSLGVLAASRLGPEGLAEMAAAMESATPSEVERLRRNISAMDPQGRVKFLRAVEELRNSKSCKI